MFLWCYGHSILVYDLVNKCEKATITSSLDVIKSICLINDDKFVCCGMRAGNVKIFNTDSGEEVFSFESKHYKDIELIDAIGDSIVTIDPFYIQTWKLNLNDKTADKIGEIFLDDIGYATVLGIKLCSDCQKILIHFACSGKHTLATFTFPKLESSEELRVYPGLSWNSLNRNLNGKLFFLRENHGIEQKEFTIRGFTIIDGESGDIINKLDLDKIGLSEGAKFKRYAISPDNDYLILYNQDGHVAKIGLNFDKDLGEILAKIKLEMKNPTEYFEPKSDLGV